MGSPVKSESFPVPRNIKSLLYDPEPQRFKKSPQAYKARVQNEVINHVANKNPKIPILQTVPPANILASCNDHDYSGSNETKFLESFGVEAITEPQIRSIEKKTRGQAKTKDSYKSWSEERSKRLQSSNFGRICKKTDRTDDDKLADSLLTRKDIHAAPLMHGRKYESVAIRKFNKQSGLKTKDCGIVVDKSNPFLGCSPDGLVSDGNLIEVKCPYTARSMEITSETVPYLKGSKHSLSLKKDHDYMYQVQGQLAICQKDKCYFVVYTFKDFEIIEIRRDDKMIDDMKSKLKTFYDEHFREALLSKHLYRSTDKFCFEY